MAKNQPKTEITTYFGQCRCCLGYAYLKNMWIEQLNDGKREIFGKMLVDCFSITWTINGQVEDDKICEDCILRLQDAVKFKNQVLNSQEDFKQNVSVGEVRTVPRSGRPRVDFNNANNSDNEGVVIKDEYDTMDNDKEFENVEFLDEDIIDDDENDHNMIPVRVRGQVTQDGQILNVQRKTINKRTRNSAKDDNGDPMTPDEEPKFYKDLLLNKHRDNIRSVLVASNATPIKGFWGTGYACHFCPQQFPNASDLKLHTLAHKNLLPTFKVKSVAEHIVKLDVTGLKCNICDLGIQSLDDLMIHLKTIHNMRVHLDVPNHIVSFDFGSDVLKCIKCSMQFDTFIHLSEHMNDVHFRNYECSVCHRGFVNINSLKTHSIRHGVAVFACAYCSKVFDTNIKMMEHERVVHHLISTNKTRKCGFCEEKFVDLIQKMNHEVKVHGVTKPNHKCGACVKVFENRRALLSHINEEHLMYKPHKCNKCDRSFYLLQELNSHMAKVHAKNSKFHKCFLCPKKYSTPAALKEHIHKHRDDKKYRCEVCGSKFHKEVNYISHIMRNKHALE